MAEQRRKGSKIEKKEDDKDKEKKEKEKEKEKEKDKDRDKKDKKKEKGSFTDSPGRTLGTAVRDSSSGDTSASSSKPTSAGASPLSPRPSPPAEAAPVLRVSSPSLSPPTLLVVSDSPRCSYRRKCHLLSNNGELNLIVFLARNQLDATNPDVLAILKRKDEQITKLEEQVAELQRSLKKGTSSRDSRRLRLLSLVADLHSDQLKKDASAANERCKAMKKQEAIRRAVDMCTLRHSNSSQPVLNVMRND